MKTFRVNDKAIAIFLNKRDAKSALAWIKYGGGYKKSQSVLLLENKLENEIKEGERK